MSTHLVKLISNLYKNSLGQGLNLGTDVFISILLGTPALIRYQLFWDCTNLES